MYDVSTVNSEFRTIARGDQRLTLLTPTDSIRDRLCSYYYWNERSGLRAALTEARGVYGTNVLPRFEEFLQLFHEEQARSKTL